MSISISKKLSSLDLSYPLWLFDLDQGPWPRKISSILPGSRPATITGWYQWPWEYGTDLRRNDDVVPAGVIDTRSRDIQRLGNIARLLEVLRYDDRFGVETFDVVFESVGNAAAGGDGGGKGQETRGFDEWVFDEGHEGYVDPRRVVQLRRKWDGVPFWDREDCWNLFDDGEARIWTSFGVASLVHNEGELIAAAGVRPRKTGEEIRKAEFEFVDGDKEAVKGIIFPRRHQTDHGLTLSRGPQFLHNRETLADTALEGAAWSDVVDYVSRKTGGPLWL